MVAVRAPLERASSRSLACRASRLRGATTRQDPYGQDRAHGARFRGSATTILSAFRRTPSPGVTSRVGASRLVRENSTLGAAHPFARHPSPPCVNIATVRAGLDTGFPRPRRDERSQMTEMRSGRRCAVHVLKDRAPGGCEVIGFRFEAARRPPRRSTTGRTFSTTLRPASARYSPLPLGVVFRTASDGAQPLDAPSPGHRNRLPDSRGAGPRSIPRGGS